ncbi:MAG: OprO/OprP family phosphate-selective porin [Acidobacteriia bacterium]|nr:OprO/OprP family phosphate-selective porin [Terriglobia bacterium]
MYYPHYAVTTLLLVASLASAQSSGAQSTSSVNSIPSAVQPGEKPDLQARLDALEHRLDQLESRVNAALPASSVAAGGSVADRFDVLDQKLQLLEHNAQVREAPTTTAGRDTFSITSPDKTFRLRVGGHLQLDAKTFAADGAHLVTDAFNIRRARPVFEGSLGKYIDFRFVPDLGNGQALVYDAYADIKITPYSVLRGGKFKTPLGLEVLQNDADRTFIENALPSDLVPNRDEGFQLHGDIAQRVNYRLAMVNGAPDGANIDGANHNGKDVVGRIFATPFAPSGLTALKGLGFGVAASTGHQDEGAVLPTFKSTGGQAVFFAYGTKTVTPFADGRRRTYVPQLYYYIGPFGLLAEYVDTAQKVAATINSLTTVHDIDNHAWQVAGSWVLTGEKKSYRSVVPRKGLEIDGDRGAGAWELVGRYTVLNVDAAAFAAGFADPAKSARAARAWNLGVNWYLNYFTKLQFEYEQTRFEQGAATGNRPTEHAFMERLQIAF